MKKKIIIVGSLFMLTALAYLSVHWLVARSIGGQGLHFDVPETAKNNEPISLKLHASITGKGGGIDKVYPGATLQYRLIGEPQYHEASGKPVPISSNFQAVASDILRYKAFEFIIPPYPKGTVGEVEYILEIEQPLNPSYPDGILHQQQQRTTKLLD